jgi:hypothetical protein
MTKEIKLKDLKGMQKFKYWIMWFVFMFPIFNLLSYISLNLYNNFYQRIFPASMILAGYVLGGFGGKALDKLILRGAVK